MGAPFGNVVLLGLGCVALAGLGGSGFLLLQAVDQRRRLRERLDAVVSPLARRRPINSASISRPEAPARAGLAARATALFGFDPAAGARYPVRWWVVLPVTLVVARIAAGLASGLLGWAAIGVVPFAWVGLSRAFFAGCEARHRQKLLVQLPDALAMIVRAVRVGVPVAEAVRLVAREAQAPTSGAFAGLVDAILIGIPLEQALRQMARQTGLGEYSFFATAVSLQAQTGGALTEVIENLADVIRRRVALQSRGRALSAEARSTAIVLAVLPFGAGAMLWVVNPGYVGLLFSEPFGRTMLSVACLSLAIGIFSMRTIIARTLA
jgi:tight adherence protein B